MTLWATLAPTTPTREALARTAHAITEWTPDRLAVPPVEPLELSVEGETVRARYDDHAITIPLAGLAAAWLGDSDSSPIQAITTWLAHRPVGDLEAAVRGVAILSESTTASGLAWQVAVTRATGTAHTWVPGLHTPGHAAATIRAQAANRSRAMRVHQRPGGGGVTSWLVREAPELSTATLAGFAARCGHDLPMTDLAVVVAPAGPVVTGPGAALERLTTELNSEHLLLALGDVPALPWR